MNFPTHQSTLKMHSASKSLSLSGHIFLQGFMLICTWKSPIFTPNPPIFASFLCVMDFIPTHFLNSQNLIQKSRCQPRSNPFFGHFYIDFRL